jgi:hypothetical protein
MQVPAPLAEKKSSNMNNLAFYYFFASFKILIIHTKDFVAGSLEH